VGVVGRFEEEEQWWRWIGETEERRWLLPYLLAQLGLGSVAWLLRTAVIFGRRARDAWRPSRGWCKRPGRGVREQSVRRRQRLLSESGLRPQLGLGAAPG
jgi:hypothetical protein